jgi:hypothetical protein
MFGNFSWPSIPLLPVSPPPQVLTLHPTTDTICRSETKKKTLEEIAAAFGDKVVLVTDMDLAVDADDKLAHAPDAVQVETARGYGGHGASTHDKV